MSKKQIVLDTNVLFAGIYSAQGASYQILPAIEKKKIVPVLSTALLFEYEEILRREKRTLRLSVRQIEVVLNGLCFLGDHQKISFLWRPFLKDPNDDHVLELAVSSSCGTIVTHNIKDFAGIDALGIRAVTPGIFWEEIS
jgi:putative PIN family toxin of toxin-antitoxin system